MTAVPMLSATAVASAFDCQQNNTQSIGSSSDAEMYSKHDAMDMNMADCHDLPSCNNSAYDCDNSQASSTASSNNPINLLKFYTTTHKSTLKNKILSSIPDSLYRPPITHLS